MFGGVDPVQVVLELRVRRRQFGVVVVHLLIERALGGLVLDQAAGVVALEFAFPFVVGPAVGYAAARAVVFMDALFAVTFDLAADVFGERGDERLALGVGGLGGGLEPGGFLACFLDLELAADVVPVFGVRVVEVAAGVGQHLGVDGGLHAGFPGGFQVLVAGLGHLLPARLALVALCARECRVEVRGVEGRMRLVGNRHRLAGQPRGEQECGCR